MQSLVERLVAELDLEPSEVIRLVGIYLTVSWEDLQKMDGALAGGDMVSLSSHAHNVKGASANLQFEEARSAAETLEMMGKNNGASEAAPVLARLRGELERIQAEMDGKKG